MLMMIYRVVIFLLKGLAYAAGACWLTGSMSYSVGMLKDKGGFDGIVTAAHELGHLFSAEHDGDPGSMCTSEAGHIMAASPVLTINSADWSPCSLSSFDKFFNNVSPECLFNEPKVSRPMPRVLPGKLLTLDQQCAKIQGTKWCKSSANPCLRLSCVSVKDDRYCNAVGDGAADGTECDTNKMCLHSKCVDTSL